MSDNEQAVLEEEETTLEVTEPSLEAEEVVEEGADAQAEGQEEDVIEGFDLSFGEESLTSEEEPEESEGIKSLREANRQKKQELKELREKVAQFEQAQSQQPAEIPFIDEKPVLEDFDYDQEEYDKALNEYYVGKQKHEAQKAYQEQQVMEVQKRVQENYSMFQKSKEAFKHPEMDDVEEEVAAALNQVDPTRSLVLLDAIKEDPYAAQKVFAIGKKKDVLQKLSAIENPVLFGMELGKALNQVSVKPRKGPRTIPEARLNTKSGKVSGATLDKLAEKRDIQGMIALKRKMRQG